MKKVTLKICEGRACQARFSNLSKERAAAEAKDTPFIKIESCGCLGKCELGPNAEIKIDNQKQILNNLTPVNIGALFRRLKKKF